MKTIAARFSIAVGVMGAVVSAVILSQAWSWTGLVAAAVCLAAMVGGVFFAFRHWVARRLAALADYFRAAASEAADAPLQPAPAEGDDEIGGLVRSFNELTERIRAAHEALESRARQRAIQAAGANAELELVRKAAETANRAKTDFLANMSHEVRTPMNAILGMTELLLDTELAGHQREYVEVIHQGGNSLLALINNVFDYSKIETGTLELEYVYFNVWERIGEVMKTLSPQASGKNIELACRIHPDVPDALIGDPARLRQVIVNLVSNAVKFTDQGEVVLEVTTESQTEGEVVLHFLVADTGMGIPEDKLGLIFEAFTQADTSTTRKYGGAGLGLAISARLVKLMGGRIWAESKVGRGSRFHFTARFHRATMRPPGVPIADPVFLQGTRVLIADDNPTNRRILEEMVQNWGMRPASVASADEALKALCDARGRGEPYRLLLSDVNMPGVDGITLAQRIRERPELKDTSVILLSSGARPDDARRAGEFGVAAHLMKPVKQSELYDAIEMTFGGKVTEAVEKQLAPLDKKPSLPPLRILVAEDSLVNQKLAVGLLEKYGHRVVVAGNGKEAVAASSSERFDAVLMDVEMPEMDGFEATAAIRAQERQKGWHLPIIAMTAHAMKGDRERCLEAGMDDYVAKPIRAQQLFRTLESVLANLGSLDAPSIAAARPAGPDWQEALESVGGDFALLRTLVQTALEETPRLLAEIREAAAQRDSATLRRHAHTLKGSLRCFGPTGAFDLARQVADVAQQGNLDEAGRIVEQLEEEMKRLLPALSNWLDRSQTV